ncbi:MAG: hypothetical protein KGI29_05250 [Pseudomonadota bacterium]|nr:hypothetical protein [Pseudomonadota bacterium]MDE3037022.1 hypothetical protein [Pseudomonadota bacterium]
MKPTDHKHIEATLHQIAKEKLCIETLETRHSDSLDFHEVSVWCLQDALEAAFRDGMAYANQQRKGK